MSTPYIEDSIKFLEQYLGKVLRIHTNDKRIFVGEMKCTDGPCNIVLGLTHEYRPPAESVVQAAIEETGTPQLQMPFQSRFVGLVVVPGSCIVKIEQEEYVGSQSSQFR